MLNGEVDLETGEPDYKLTNTEVRVLHTLLRTWDDMKEGLEIMIGSVDAKAITDILCAFLIESKGRNCKICGKGIRSKQKTMHKHFVDRHWPKEMVTERIDSMEVIDAENGEGEVAAEPAKTTENATVEGLGDAMETSS